jgi:tRNA modification GTPase
MDFLTSTDPIIACSSGALANTAISIVRISGLNSFESINDLFSIDLLTIKPRYAYYCDLKEGDKLIDQIVLTWFKAPSSFNGENIIELGVHGNILNIERIINIFNAKGIRTASAGEFTYRALRNKKLTLSQVEGLDLLINANSNFGLNQGFSLMNGKLQKDYTALNQSFLNHKSAVELSIDFLEDVGEEQADKQFNSTLSELDVAIEMLRAHVSNESFNLLSPEVALIGLPNAGKSSLFNILLRDKRAIVSSIAGTTRDYISEKIKINENFFNLVDTAGIRSSQDFVESEGIRRSLEIAQTSFFKILVVNPFDINADFFEQIRDTSIDLLIFSHNDSDGFDNRLVQAIETMSKIFGPIEPVKSGPIGAENCGPIEPVKSGPIGAENCGPIEPTKSGPIGAENCGPIEPAKSGPIGAVNSHVQAKEFIPYICANLSQDNLVNVEEIELYISKKFKSILQNEPVLIERHKEVINKIYFMLCDYKTLASEVGDISIISSELNTIGNCISELIGILSPDDVLHNIFDNFCIGK